MIWETPPASLGTTGLDLGLKFWIRV